jgi:hypothetical protein
MMGVDVVQFRNRKLLLLVSAVPAAELGAISLLEPLLTLLLLLTCVSQITCGRIVDFAESAILVWCGLRQHLW